MTGRCPAAPSPRRPPFRESGHHAHVRRRKPTSLWLIRTTTFMLVMVLPGVLAGLVATSVPAEARTVLVVPRDYATIQAAVNAAAPGSTVRVEPGTYTEQLVIDKDLTLTGAGAGCWAITPDIDTPHIPSTTRAAIVLKELII